MKKVFIMLLCAASVALVGCKENKEQEPQGPTYSVSDEVDFNVMKTLAAQFSADSVAMEGVIKNLGFTVMTKSQGNRIYFRSENESKNPNVYPCISMLILSDKTVDRVNYQSYTSNNVVSTKAQIMSQMGETVKVMTIDYPFIKGRINKDAEISTYASFIQQIAPCNTIYGEWSQKNPDGTARSNNYLTITITYDSNANLTGIAYTCTQPYTK